MDSGENFHDAYLNAWNQALDAGDPAPIVACLAPGYHGWTGTGAATAEHFTHSEALEGFAEAARALQGATVHAQQRTTTPRGNDEAVVFYEMSFRREDQVIARAVLLESWKRGSDGWRLHRDVTEQNTAPAAGPDITD